MTAYRKSPQPLLPKTAPQRPAGQYDIYPAFDIGPGRIEQGFGPLADRLAAALAGGRSIVMDGYGGVLWEELREPLDAALRERGTRAGWVSAEAKLRPSAEIDELIAPFLGGDDPLFGRRFGGRLADFFRREIPADNLGASGPVIVYGTGAALVWGQGRDAYYVYLDVPKNEIQYRARAGSIRNLGAAEPAGAGVMYKRFYFVDWPALNAHKQALLPGIDLYVDAQDPDSPALVSGNALRGALAEMAQTYCRVRPWFEPGPWGGQWMKQRIAGLAQDVPNYAWSFEMIAPEQGIVLESGGRLLEASFDLLMFQEAEAVLGAHAERFGVQYPVRFDFLDTFNGGNLSLQTHPRPAYIRRHFGEDFTQDETYYILDCQPGAQVYLGFQDGVDPAEFRAALEASLRDGAAVEVERFVRALPAEKHGLYLIPNGTVHCSGAGNMVLEISATPYIFTFKMYDWLRLDLAGKPRPLNIARAFDNLHFERRGALVERELVSQPVVLEQDEGWRLSHLPTHPAHFYDVHRMEFSSRARVKTDGSPHLLMLVEGTSAMLRLPSGRSTRMNYAETFMVPAAAGSYALVNEGAGPAVVVKAFLKAGWTEPAE